MFQSGSAEAIDFVLVPDYSAAHSMDTTWFATDRDGHVACFESGQPGVVPADWYAAPKLEWIRQLRGPEFSCWDEDDLLVDILRMMPELVVANLRELRPPAQYRLSSDYSECRDAVHDWDIGMDSDREYWIHSEDDLPYLLVLSSPTAADSLDVERLATPDIDAAVCLVRSLRWADYQRLHREYIPADPLLVDQLPASTADYLRLIRFEDVDFSTVGVLDIPQSVFCYAYGNDFWELDRDTDTVHLALTDPAHVRYDEYLQKYRESYPRLSAWAASQGFAIEPPPDYPAAHSADTTWFAVDRDGHVGRFVTLENGTLPAAEGEINRETLQDAADVIGRTDVLPRPNDFWSLDDVAAELIEAGIHSSEATTDIIYNLRACLAGEHSWNGLFTVDGEPIAVLRKRRLVPVVGIVKSLELVQRSLNIGLASLADQIPPGPPYVVLFGNLTLGLARELVASEQCFSLRSVRDRESLVHCGAFDYIYDGSFGPYVGHLIPKSPLHIDQLPKQLRELIARVRFDNLSFAETNFLQPAEHVPCLGERGAQHIREDLVKCRIAAESRSIATIQPEPDDMEDDNASDHAAWTSMLLEQIEDFRETEPTRFSPDLVRVSLEFDSSQAVMDILRAADEEAEAGDFVVRGRGVVFLDQGITDPSSAYERRFSPDDTYAWLGKQIEKGRFSTPRILLSRPMVQPPMEQSQELREELADVRTSFATMLGNRVLTEIDSDEILQCGSEAVRLGLMVFVLNGVLRRRREPDELEYPVDGREPLVFVVPREGVYCTVIARLIPELTATNLEDFALIRRMTAHVQLVDVFRLLELRMLSLLARDGLLPEDEIEGELLSLVHERDVDLPLDELLPLLESACTDTGLPGHVLRQSVEVALVRADHVYPHCDIRRNPQAAERCRNILSQLDRVS